MTFPQFLAKFLLNDFKGMLKAHKLKIETRPVDPSIFGFIVWLVWRGMITRFVGREMLNELLDDRQKRDKRPPDLHS